MGELLALKLHLTGRQSSVIDMSVEAGCCHSQGERSDCITLGTNMEKLINKFSDAFLCHRILVQDFASTDFHSKAVLLWHREGKPGVASTLMTERGPDSGCSTSHNQKRLESMDSRCLTSRKYEAVG